MGKNQKQLNELKGDEDLHNLTPEWKIHKK